MIELSYHNGMSINTEIFDANEIEEMPDFFSLHKVVEFEKDGQVDFTRELVIMIPTSRLISAKKIKKEG